MSICAVVGCANRRYKSKADTDASVISYHRFPKDETLRSVWINYCCLKDHISVTSSRICSAHFEESSFVRDLQYELLGKPPRRILIEDAVPTKRLPHSPTNRPKKDEQLGNYFFLLKNK